MKKLFILSALVISASALAHSGRTDSSGCHNERRTGGYHCHKSDGTSANEQKARNPASAEEIKLELKNQKTKKVMAK